MGEPDTGASGHIKPRSFWHKALLCCGGAGAALFNLVYFTFGLISPHYYILAQPVSDLQHVPYGWVQSANCVVGGLLICLFAIGLRIEMRGGFGAATAPLCNMVTGVALALIGKFNQGEYMLYLGIVIFLSVLVTILLMAYRFAMDSRWPGWANYSVISVMLIILFTGIFSFLLIDHGAYLGIFERLSIVTRLLWMVFFTWRLMEGRRLSPVENKQAMMALK